MFPDETPEVLSQRLLEGIRLCDLNLQLARAGVVADFPEATPVEVNNILWERLERYRLEKWKAYGLLKPEAFGFDRIAQSSK
ncbi:MAG TPA: hypothetical protein PLX97_01775 [Gemmatales bacterium]|nr:hypothetical protein [Gemmatales bacterium]